MRTKICPELAPHLLDTMCFNPKLKSMYVPQSDISILGSLNEENLIFDNL